MNFQQAMKDFGVRVIQDNYVEWRSCHRKRRYDTQTAAQAALDRTLRDQDSPLNIYTCEHCFGFHVGHVTTFTVPVLEGVAQ